MKVLLTHPGTQYAPRLAAELHRHGLLLRYVTGFAVAGDGWLSRAGRALPGGLGREWNARRVDGVPAARLATFPRVELAAVWRLRGGEPAEQVLSERNEVFQQRLPVRWLEEATHVVGFDTSSWLLARRARDLGRGFVLDQSIGHPVAKERVYAGLRTRFPEWADSVPLKAPALLARESLEHALADAIVAPSGFVGRTLVENGVDPAVIRVIPFGTDLELFQPAAQPPAEPVVFLFVGSLSARKGVPCLLRAWERMRPAGLAELWFAGAGQVPPSERERPGVRWLGPLGRMELAEVLRRAHVLVCPSFFEGLAQVQVEALAAGVPVIGTPASGAEEIVAREETGFVVEAGDDEALAEAMSRLAGDANLRCRLRRNAIAGRARHGWAEYGLKWRELLEDLAASAGRARALQPQPA